MMEPEFKKWVGSVDTVTLVCWDLGHIWDADIYDSIERVSHGAHLLHGQCEREVDDIRCEVKRARYLTSTWSPDPNRNIYTYPRGYSPRGMMHGEAFFMDAEHRAAIRKEIARRAAETKAERARAAKIKPEIQHTVNHGEIDA